MESNKIMIGVEICIPNEESVKYELIVLRDIMLVDLLDGIVYGLQKLARNGSELDAKCLKEVDACLNVANNVHVYNGILLTSFNPQSYKDSGREGAEGSRLCLHSSDFTKNLDALGFISSTRIIFDRSGTYRSYHLNLANIIPAFNPANNDNAYVFPDYNISSRQFVRFDTTPVTIIPATDPPQKSKRGILMTLLPALLMAGTMVLVRSMMSSGNNRMIIMSVAMSGVTLVVSIVNFISDRITYKRDLKTWREQYTLYISRVIDKIETRKIGDVEKMKHMFPDIGVRMGYLCDTLKPDKAVFNLCGDIYSRAPGDPDFLTVRIGTSDQVPCQFEIEGSGEERIAESAYYRFSKEKGLEQIILTTDKGFMLRNYVGCELSTLSRRIAYDYRFLHDAPLLYSIRSCGTLGIISRQKTTADFMIQRMLFDLCFYHKPEDLQVVMLFPETDNRVDQEYLIQNYKFLPHFRELFKNRSQFAFDSVSATELFSHLLSIMARRAAQEADTLPHIVVVVYEEYGLKEHAFAQFLPSVPIDGKPFENTLGLTFIFPKPYREHLPAFCSHVIEFESDDKGKDAFDAQEVPADHQHQYMQYTYRANLVPHEDLSAAKAFRMSWNRALMDYPNNLYNAYKILAALSYARISSNAKVPSNVGMFELFGIHSTEIDIAKYWGKRGEVRKCDPARTLAVPIGKTENGQTCLDLHERGDGPHMLVAGTTGSGKSETILTYLLGLSLYFRPDEVNLMLVDMKGGGFIKRVGDLPHVVGSVTDVDGDENGTGESYMLRRFLNALRSEIRRRKIKLNAMHVDNVNDYIKVTRNEATIESHISKVSANSKEKALTDAEKDTMRRMAEKEPMTQLILIVDEFTELKRFSSESDDIDFIKEITTIARVGRSLGIHIVLISQNIEGAVTEDISVNSRSRLCLKVATRAASKQMIGTDLAAAPDMPGNGRAYLLVGTGSKFEYFQSGYSGAPAESTMAMPFQIMKANKSGKNTLFYDSASDNDELNKKREELKKQGLDRTQLDVLVSQIILHYRAVKHEYAKPHIVFQKPLPSKVCLKNGVLYEMRDGAYKVREEE